MNILKEAHTIVFERAEEKERQYGPFSEGMRRAALVASVLCNKEITANEVYKVMMALKISRMGYSEKRDSKLDLIAYIAAYDDFLFTNKKQNKMATKKGTLATLFLGLAQLFAEAAETADDSIDLSKPLKQGKLALVEEDDDEDEPPAPKAKGKKKAAPVVEEDDDEDEDEEEEIPAPKSKKKKAPVVEEDEDEEEEAPVAKKSTITLAVIRKLISEKAGTAGTAKVLKLLNKYDAESGTELDEKHYAKFHADLSKL